MVKKKKGFISLYVYMQIIFAHIFMIKQTNTQISTYILLTKTTTKITTLYKNPKNENIMHL